MRRWRIEIATPQNLRPLLRSVTREHKNDTVDDGIASSQRQPPSSC